MVPKSIRLDAILYLLTSTRTPMDGHYLGQFHAHGYGHDSPFEAGMFSLLSNPHRLTEQL